MKLVPFFLAALLCLALAASCAGNSRLPDPSAGTCGDGACGDGETPSSCCNDCGCPPGRTCGGGVCETDACSRTGEGYRCDFDGRCWHYDEH